MPSPTIEGIERGLGRLGPLTQDFPLGFVEASRFRLLAELGAAFEVTGDHLVDELGGPLGIGGGIGHLDQVRFGDQADPEPVDGPLNPDVEAGRRGDAVQLAVEDAGKVEREEHDRLHVVDKAGALGFFVPVGLEDVVNQGVASDERHLAVHVLFRHALHRRPSVGVGRHDQLGAIRRDHQRRAGPIHRALDPDAEPDGHEAGDEDLKNELPPAMEDGDDLTPGDLLFVHLARSSEGRNR